MSHVRCESCGGLKDEYDVLACGGCGKPVCKRCRVGKKLAVPNANGEYLVPFHPRCAQ